MRDALKSYLALAGGVTEVTRQRAVEAARALVASGEAAAEQVTGLAEDLLSQTRQNREAVAALVGFEVDRTLGRVGLASADEVTALTERVRALERRLAEQTGGAGAGPAKVPATAPAKAAKAPAKAPAPAPGTAARAPVQAQAKAAKALAKKAPAKKAGG